MKYRVIPRWNEFLKKNCKKKDRIHPSNIFFGFSLTLVRIAERILDEIYKGFFEKFSENPYTNSLRNPLINF